MGSGRLVQAREGVSGWMAATKESAMIYKKVLTEGSTQTPEQRRAAGAGTKHAGRRAKAGPGKMGIPRANKWAEPRKRKQRASFDDHRNEKPSPALEQAAEKVRHIAEAEATQSAQQAPSETTAVNDSQAAEAFYDLQQPELSKGRPGPSSPKQPSNAGNDGP